MIPHQRLQYRNVTIQVFFMLCSGFFFRNNYRSDLAFFFFFLIRSNFVAHPSPRLAVVLLSDLLRARAAALNLHAWSVSRFSVRGCRC